MIRPSREDRIRLRLAAAGRREIRARVRARVLAAAALAAVVVGLVVVGAVL